MPYYVCREGKSSWRLMHRQGALRRTVPKTSTEALEAGFQRGFGLEEAQGRAKQLKAEAWVKRHAERAHRESQLANKVRSLRNAFLREEDVLEFERLYLKEKRIRPTHWRTAQRIIYATETHPSEWFERPSLIYDLVVKRGYSRTYAQKLRRILNLWGYFLCKKQGRAWKDLEPPAIYWKVRLVDIKRHKSVTLGALESAVLPEEERRWVERCFWFGLRPQECDLLATDPSKWAVVKAEGYEWLEVLQVKLLERGVPEEKAWKRIPVWTAEQKRIVGELGLPAKRPTVFAFKSAFAGLTPYGLRQGFSDWLREQPEIDLERRSAYLGHLSTRTTEQSYTDKTKRLPPKKVTGG